MSMISPQKQKNATWLAEATSQLKFVCNFNHLRVISHKRSWRHDMISPPYHPLGSRLTFLFTWSQESRKFIWFTKKSGFYFTAFEINQAHRASIRVLHTYVESLNDDLGCHVRKSLHSNHRIHSCSVHKKCVFMARVESNLPKEVGNTEASARNKFFSSQHSQSGVTTPSSGVEAIRQELIWWAENNWTVHKKSHRYELTLS